MGVPFYEPNQRPGWTLIGSPFTFEGESGRCVTDESVLPRLRVILLDFNLVSIKYQRTLAWGLPIVGLIVMFVVWIWIL